MGAKILEWKQTCEIHECGKRRKLIGNGKFIYVCQKCLDAITELPPPDGYANMA
jgi:hypothetical protein